MSTMVNRMDSVRPELKGAARSQAATLFQRGERTGEALVSVIIPCYNHARYLGEAIASVEAQRYPHHEIIVVDDGSTDETAAVATRYPGVKYIWQRNQGLSAARNTGIRHSEGTFLVFLDADDRLLPRALEVGLLCLQARPDCAFASGHYRYIGADGSLLVEHPQDRVTRDHYLALLCGNYIGMHATVIYRRSLFDRVGGFDTTLRACEDYDLYLRIARQFPIFCHDEVVAEYRQHGANMSGNPELMLNQVLRVLRRQQPHLQGDPARQRAYRRGVLAWQAYYGRAFFAQAAGLRNQGAHGRGAATLLAAARQVPLYAAYHTAKWLFDQGYWLLYNAFSPPARARIAHLLYRLTAPRIGRVRMADLRSLQPLGQAAAQENGARIDSYYVAGFLADQSHYVRGRVLEIGAPGLAAQLGGERVTAVDQLPDLAGASRLVDDLAGADRLPPNQYDCILLVQTLQRIYDLAGSVDALYRLLRPGGVALVTAPGLGLLKARINEEAGYWAFTERTLHNLFAPRFGNQAVQVTSYGNVLAATAFFHGLAAAQLEPHELAQQDPQYPLVITLKAFKEQNHASAT